MPPRPTLHLPLNGSLTGTANGAPVTATGAGALRYRASDLAGRSCALVEEAGTNYLRNPALQTATTGWIAGGSSSLSRVTANPGGQASYAVRFVDGSGAGYVLMDPGAFLSGATAGRTFTGSVDLWLPASLAGRTARLYLRESGGATGIEQTGSAALGLSPGWNRLAYTRAIIRNDRTSTDATTSLSARLTGDTYDLARGQIEERPYASTFIPELDAGGSLLPGYSWTGTPHNSESTRALTTVEIAYPGAIQHLYCRYSEDWGATWSTAHLTGAGTIGSYGVVQLTAGVLHIESSRALMVRDLAVYDVALSAAEQAAVSAAVTNGSIGQDTGFAPGLLLPV